MTERLTPDDLRTLFLFESLDDDKLAWLAEHSRVQHWAAGETVYAQGDPATCFFVLLDGTISLRRRVEGHDLETSRTSQRGVYSGATQAFALTDGTPPYPSSVVALTDSSFLLFDARPMAEQIRVWFPMAMHLVEGLFVGIRTSQEAVSQRERLLSLGRITAGLTHELNNPAAAAVRATATLRERFAAMRHKLANLADGKVDADTLIRLTDVQEEALERLKSAPDLSPVQVSDAEDELSDWLDDHEVAGGWELAPTLVAAGLGTDWLDRVAAAVREPHLGLGLRWLTYTLETVMLLDEIDDSTTRISALVGAAKQYSQMDRAPRQDVDVHEGIKSTLVMLAGKLRGVEVVKDLDRTLPKIPAYPAELNQVWTNLVENAVQAMDGAGTLTIRTARDGGHLLVEIGDTGPGVPESLRQKIFEPFFTTKPVGEGTGLGLDISYRIVVQKHHGDLRVESVPGDTRFQVRLPFEEPAD